MAWGSKLAKYARAAAVAAAAIGAVGAHADDFFGAVATQSTQPTEQPRAWRHRAWLQQKTAYGYRTPALPASRDRAALTRAETEFYGEFDWRNDAWRVHLAGAVIQDWLPDLAAAGLWSAYDLNSHQRDQRRWRFEGADSYVSWQQGDWWIKGGYQTLAWGEAETLKVTDVLARRDQRWPGQEDLEQLRLPVAALRVNWRGLDALLLPHMPLDRQPAPFDEFDPYLALRYDATTPALERSRGDYPGWALRWQHRGPGLDAQLMIADVYSFEAAPEAAVLATTPVPHLQRLHLQPWRQQVLGLGLQTARGVWVLKTEQAWHHDVQLPEEDSLMPWQEHNQWRSMLGAEYSGIRDLTITGEVTWQYTAGDNAKTAVADWETGQALRLGYQLLNQRVSLNALVMRLSGGDGYIARLAAEMELMNELTAGVTWVEYGAASATRVLYPYRHNDTLMFTLRLGL